MKALTVLSGGLDSTVTLARMKSEAAPSTQLGAVAFDYGQTHRIELEAARKVAEFYSLPLKIQNIEGLLRGSVLLGEGEVPLGPYEDETMKSTVVHGRNMLFASIAVSLAGEGGEVWLGVHRGDHAVYPDCRPSFWEPFSVAVKAAYGVSIRTPFLHSDKTQIVRKGAALKAPMELTWSCYQGKEFQCGECGTCVERREAFRLAGVEDSTRYVR